MTNLSDETARKLLIELESVLDTLWSLYVSHLVIKAVSEDEQKAFNDIYTKKASILGPTLDIIKKAKAELEVNDA